MNFHKPKSAFRFLLGGAAWCLFLIAAFLLIWGGRLYAELTGANRFAAEMGGIALAVVFGGLGAAMKAAQRHVEAPPGDKADG